MTHLLVLAALDLDEFLRLVCGTPLGMAVVYEGPSKDLDEFWHLGAHLDFPGNWVWIHRAFAPQRVLESVTRQARIGVGTLIWDPSPLPTFAVWDGPVFMAHGPLSEFDTSLYERLMNDTLYAAGWSPKLGSEADWRSMSPHRLVRLAALGSTKGPIAVDAADDARVRSVWPFSS